MVCGLLGTVLAWSLGLAAQAVSGPRPIVGTYWKAIELEGRPVPAQESIRGIYVVLADHGRVYGSDGCNRVSGTYEPKKASVTFRAVAASQMACIDADVLDVVFLGALKNARRLTIAGQRMDLLDSDNRRVAAFQSVTP